MQVGGLIHDDGIEEPVHIPNPKPRQLKTLILLMPFVLLSIGLLLVGMYYTRVYNISTVMPRPDMVLQWCSPGNFLGLEHWTRPPAKTMHNMTDAELLWAASFDPRVKDWPYERVPKVAFMFLTRGPLPLAPLWEKFFEGHERRRFSIYVHSLPGYVPDFPLESVFYQRQIPSQEASWGEMSMCDAERRLLANALLDLSNERFVLLSESCIPLFNFRVTYLYLVNSWISYVQTFDDPGPFGRGRYDYNMAPEVELAQWRKGSQWFEVNRELAVRIVADTKYYRKFHDFCVPSCYVDEHYFPTMLSIDVPGQIANRSVTWVDWSRGGSHPGTFGREDVTAEFVKRIAEGERCEYNGKAATVCMLFARKFSPSALEPLMKVLPIEAKSWTI